MKGNTKVVVINMEEILKLLDNASDTLHITNNYGSINIS